MLHGAGRLVTCGGYLGGRHGLSLGRIQSTTGRCRPRLVIERWRSCVSGVTESLVGAHRPKTVGSPGRSPGTQIVFCDWANPASDSDYEPAVNFTAVVEAALSVRTESTLAPAATVSVPATKTRSGSDCEMTRV